MAAFRWNVLGIHACNNNNNNQRVKDPNFRKSHVQEPQVSNYYNWNFAVGDNMGLYAYIMHTLIFDLHASVC